MNNKILSKIVATVGFMTLTFSLIPSAEAIGIRPIRHEVNVKPGETIEATVTVINETDKDFSAEPSLLAFYKNDQNGFPIFVSEKNPELEDTTTWVEISKEPVMVPARGSTNVKYKVNVPTTAKPGGKYVSVAYQPVKGEVEGVKVNVRAASLLFLNVEGEIIRKGEVTQFGLPENQATDQPFTFDVNFKNTGNTHIKPTGSIEIVDQTSGEKLTKIAKYLDPESNEEIIADVIPINLNKTNVLPNSDRIFKGEWVENIKEGKFKAIMEVNYLEGANPIKQEFEFEIKENLKVDDFKINTEGSKADFQWNMTNEGAGDQKLRGKIVVKNAFNYMVAEIPLPADIEYVKPGENKTITLNWLEKAIPKGSYTANLEAEYGFSKKKVNEEISFGDTDKTKIILIGALGLVTIVALISIFRRKKRRTATRRHRK